jgi:hypothetical protein
VDLRKEWFNPKKEKPSMVRPSGLCVFYMEYAIRIISVFEMVLEKKLQEEKPSPGFRFTDASELFNENRP